MSSCHTQSHSGCSSSKKKFDWLLWGSTSVIAVAVIAHLTLGSQLPSSLEKLSHSIVHLLHRMWWGVALGIAAVGFLSKIPREFVMSLLGTQSGLKGLLRATALGLLLDLCSHGILLVGMKLYERGATLGQTMAFLIASPWNSFSLTFILITLIGWKWTLAFIVLSAVVAILSGLIFDALVKRKVLPENAHTMPPAEDFKFWSAAKSGLSSTKYDFQFFKDVASHGIKESRMILRWLLFGVVLAALISAFVPTNIFSEYFGPTTLGLGLTLVAATVIEVCSEGSAPIAADILNRATAPGNGFTFLMAGVSTDYTEIMGIKDSMKSWKIALFLPLVTLPQILILGWVLNQV